MEKSKIRCAVNEVRYMEFIHVTLHVGLPQAVKITLIQCTVVPSYTVREQLQNSNEQVVIIIDASMNIPMPAIHKAPNYVVRAFVVDDENRSGKSSRSSSVT